MENRSFKDRLQESKQRLAERLGQIQSSDLPKSSNAARPDSRPLSASFSSKSLRASVTPAVSSLPPASRATPPLAVASSGSPAKSAQKRDPNDIDGNLADLENRVDKVVQGCDRFWAKTDDDIKLMQDKIYNVRACIFARCFDDASAGSQRCSCTLFQTGHGLAPCIQWLRNHLGE
jgi:hypothetical protein